MSTDNVIPFRGTNGSGLPPRPPVEPMDPRMAAFLLHGVCERLDRLEGTLELLSQNLKAKEGLWYLCSLAGLCSDEAGDIYRALLPLIKGLEANCEPDVAPEVPS